MLHGNCISSVKYTVKVKARVFIRMWNVLRNDLWENIDRELIILSFIILYFIFYHFNLVTLRASSFNYFISSTIKYKLKIDNSNNKVYCHHRNVSFSLKKFHSIKRILSSTRLLWPQSHSQKDYLQFFILSLPARKLKIDNSNIKV